MIFLAQEPHRPTYECVNRPDLLQRLNDMMEQDLMRKESEMYNIGDEELYLDVYFSKISRVPNSVFQSINGPIIYCKRSNIAFTDAEAQFLQHMFEKVLGKRKC